MSKRIEKIISIVKAYNKNPLETNSTDVDNTIKLEYSLEIEQMYRNVEKKEVREDIMDILDLLKKIDRSHGGDTIGKELLLDTLVYLERL